MENLIVITALGEDRPGLIDQLSKSIADAGCGILDSRMTVLGGEFAIIQLVSGRWNALAKLEGQLPIVAKELGLELHLKRTIPTRQPGDLLPYAVDVVTMDQPGIVHQIAHFFSQREINIRDLATNRYNAAHTGTPMYSVHLTVDIPAKLHVAMIREEFLDFCDQGNLDAIFEPVKG
ncbi:glycine cleavage system transcriptional repressor [Natronocella acetinitrilica]|uniref:Glycine cleavage system transcriptional repressor n=1 Tax=Natronocella acetinitrilica TaxID=414046 RepID=A0AAE3G571_9GAMM|nr:glycine cleavage system protein R [Natronocella acetinitrilica]MCP1674067.1 glycine cleavage system transcriptional repressor [Natronocella acetinitrilica]